MTTNNLQLNTNESTDLLIKNNAQAVNSLEYILKILRTEPQDNDIKRTNDRANTSFDLPEPSATNLDSTLAYVQTLIDELTTITVSSLLYLAKQIPIQRTGVDMFNIDDDSLKFPTLLQKQINIKVYGDSFIDSHAFKEVLATPSLKTCVRELICNIFVGAEADYHPVNNILTRMHLPHYHGTKKPHPFPKANPYFIFSDYSVTNTSHISSQMIVNAFVSQIFSELIERAYPNAKTAISVKRNYVGLVVYSGLDTQDISLSNDTQSERYYNVCYQGFTGNKNTACGTTPVRCNKMFSQDALQLMIAIRSELDSVLITSWQKLDSKKDYEDFME